MRALLAMAGAGEGVPVKGDALASGQGIPLKFLENILIELRRVGLVESRRGSEGGYWLARPASEIAVADVFRALDGPLAEVRGLRPESAHYQGPAEHLQDVWIAVRASLREVLENVTLADIASGNLPAVVERLRVQPDAYLSRKVTRSA